MVTGDNRVQLTSGGEEAKALEEGARFLRDLIEQQRPIYGVNTGFGDSYTETVDPGRRDELPAKLIAFHGCGTGDVLSPEQSLTTLLIRLITLAQPHSGVRPELLRTMCEYVNRGIAPVIPEEGSVGASGDLTPLSYVAAALQGERSVWFNGTRRPTREVLGDLEVEPVALKPKEALALMNGTSVTTALLCHACRRAGYLVRITSLITAINVLALRGNPEHFHPKIFELKPHPGPKHVAARVRELIPDSYAEETREREVVHQDRYSLRCAPHVIGVLADALSWMRDQVEIEITGVDDNPLLDPQQDRVLHGGNFYGGHAGFVADSLKNAVANLSDLMDRQLASLVDPKLNRNLPANLVGSENPGGSIDHGFKALQIATSSWAAEAAKQSMPAGVFSRSTESHNQDKVSMSTIGARDALRILELTEQTVAAALMGSLQALEIRVKQGQLDERDLSPKLDEARKAVREEVSFLAEDRRLDRDLRRLVTSLRDRGVPAPGIGVSDR